MTRTTTLRTGLAALSALAFVAATPLAWAQSSPPAAGTNQQKSQGGPMTNQPGAQGLGQGGDTTGSITSAPKRGMDPKCTEVMQNQTKHSKAEVDACGQQQE